MDHLTKAIDENVEEETIAPVIDYDTDIEDEPEKELNERGMPLSDISNLKYLRGRKGPVNPEGFGRCQYDTRYYF